jgi:hypothetical protein
VNRNVVSPAAAWTWSRTRSFACCPGVRWYRRPSVSERLVEAGAPSDGQEAALELRVGEGEGSPVAYLAKGPNARATSAASAFMAEDGMRAAGQDRRIPSPVAGQL